MSRFWIKGEYEAKLSADGVPLKGRMHTILTSQTSQDDSFHLAFVPEDQDIEVCRGSELAFLCEKYSMHSDFMTVPVSLSDDKKTLHLPDQFRQKAQMSNRMQPVIVRGYGDFFVIVTPKIESENAQNRYEQLGKKDPTLFLS